MREKVRFLGLDVHAETIAVAIAEPDGEARSLGMIAGHASDLRCGSGKREFAEEIEEIAWKAQHRLHKCYCRLAATRKDQRKIITALGRELLGFIWTIGIKAETAARQPIAA